MTTSLPIKALAIVGAAAALAFAGQAMAHAHLVGSEPAAGVAGAPTRTVMLRFSETLEPKFSAATLATAAGKPVDVTSTVAGKQMTVTAPVPLVTGAYRLSWHVVSRDGHRTQGGYAFAIR